MKNPWIVTFLRFICRVFLAVLGSVSEFWPRRVNKQNLNEEKEVTAPLDLKSPPSAHHHEGTNNHAETLIRNI